MRAMCMAVAIASATASSVVNAQELRVITLDRETKQPVPNALITLLSRRQEPVDTTRTAADGSFGFRVKEAGKFFLRIHRTGLPVEETDAIFLENGQTRFDTLFLEPARPIQNIEELVSRELFRLFGVSLAGLPPRAVLLGDELEQARGGARAASDLILQRGPGFVSVRGAGSGRVCYRIHNGECALVYVNAQQVPSNSDIPAQDLEAIVVLTPLDTQTALGRNNGVILLFTRGSLRRTR